MKLLKKRYRIYFGYDFKFDFLIVTRYNYFSTPIFSKYPIRHIEFGAHRTVYYYILRRCRKEFKNNVLST